MSDMEELDSEFEMKRLIRTITPLMAILTDDGGRRRFGDGGVRRDHRDQTALASYWSRDGGYGYGGGYGSSCCCNDKTDLYWLLALAALGLLFFYLIFIATTTTTSGGRRRRDNELDDLLRDGDDDDGIS